MRFEYDPKKSASNKAKHGLDFEEAQAIWNDPQRLELDARSSGEPRSVVIGAIGGKLWTAVFTLRDQAVRLISTRRARDKESELYEDNQGE